MCRSGLAPLLMALLLAASARGWAQDGSLRFSPPEWDYGEIPSGAPVSLEVTVANHGDETVEVTFLPTCDCLEAQPRTLQIPGGQSAAVALTFDPADYNGPTELDFIVRTTVEGMEKALFRVSGTVEGAPAAPESTEPAQGGEDSDTVTVAYYYSAGCRSCERFLATEIPRLERRFDVAVRVERRNIFDTAVFEEYTALVAELGVEQGDLPALLVGRRLLQGDREIRDRLDAALEAFLADRGAGALRLPAGGSAGPSAAIRELRLLPVVAGGLLDGINPCAFTTLVFLVSALAVAGRGRREVLIIGGFFTASVFASYFAIGLGAFSALRAASGFPVVATVLKWVLFAVLVLFAALSVYDYAVIRRGDPTRILLQLPTALKLRIHASIRAGARSAAMVASTVLMGFLVSVFELACTGQVYFPTIAYLVRAEAGTKGYLFLVLYNVGFIVPLVAVFLLTFFGLTSKRLGELMRRSMGPVKLGLATLFVALAVLTVAL